MLTKKRTCDRVNKSLESDTQTSKYLEKNLKKYLTGTDECDKVNKLSERQTNKEP